MEHFNLNQMWDEILHSLEELDDRCPELLTLLEQFCSRTDGVNFLWRLECCCFYRARSYEGLVTKNAFEIFVAALLLNSKSARSLAELPQLSPREHQQALVFTLTNVLALPEFTETNVLEKASLKFIIHATQLMGNYFTEGRLCRAVGRGNRFKAHKLALPLVKYMRALAISGDAEAYNVLAIQLKSNIAELRQLLPSAVEELSSTIENEVRRPRLDKRALYCCAKYCQRASWFPSIVVEQLADIERALGPATSRPSSPASNGSLPNLLPPTVTLITHNRNLSGADADTHSFIQYSDKCTILCEVIDMPYFWSHLRLVMAHFDYFRR